MSQAEQPGNTGVTVPLGFLAGATSAGVKLAKGARLDLGILSSEVPCAVAGVFTRNKVKAAPVLLTMERMRGGRAQAVVFNSGNAIACTGESGRHCVLEMTRLTAEKLCLAPSDVLVASTGIIGVAPPTERILAGIQEVSLSREGGHSAALSIMTTDLRPKETAVEFNTAEGTARIGGMTKGSGMIHPNMGTMLAFLTTDANVEPGYLREALVRAVDASFNMITVDGETSTNDTVLILANGLAGNSPIAAGSPASAEFERALAEVTTYLAKEIARDGEGATKLIEVRVSGAASLGDARLAARGVAGSDLFKAAVYGRDPNWGRIISAIGHSGAEVQSDLVDISIGSALLVRGGVAADFDKSEAVTALSGAEVVVTVNLNLGGGSATAWGCDLTEKYVDINAEYST